MFGPKVVLSNHPDMIATVAGTLGYMPHDSIVLFFYGGRRPGPVHRFDAPMPDQLTEFGISMKQLFHGQRVDATGVYIYIFSDDLDRGQVRHLGAGLVGEALAAVTGAAVADAVRVTSAGWESLLHTGSEGSAEQIAQSVDLIAWASDERIVPAPQRGSVEPPAYRADEAVAARVAKYRAGYGCLAEVHAEELWEQRHPLGRELPGLWEHLIAGGRGEIVERLAAVLVYPSAARFAVCAVTARPGSADFELTWLRTLGVTDVPGGVVDVDPARAQALRDGLHAVAGCTPVADRAHVFALLGLLAWMGGHGADAIEWLEMASEVEVADENGVSKAPLVAIVMTAMNTLGVHPAVDKQQT
ncbi:DUF4192 family protein [Kocuria rosea]|uniref:DUF4192 family protein n=1 Tax=Kocuria rosea TaxID=1275 RepID=UPI0011A695BE|nr:DUF4192 family protein [Kocuria rosea]